MGVRFAGSPIGFPPQAALATVPDREAADSENEQICTQSVVPAPVGGTFASAACGGKPMGDPAKRTPIGKEAQRNE